jgi:hypothetical protein
MISTHIIDASSIARKVKRHFVVDAGGVTRTTKRMFIVDSGGVARLVYQAEQLILSSNYTTGVGGASSEIVGYLSGNFGSITNPYYTSSDGYSRYVWQLDWNGNTGRVAFSVQDVSSVNVPADTDAIFKRLRVIGYDDGVGYIRASAFTTRIEDNGYVRTWEFPAQTTAPLVGALYSSELYIA